MAHFPNGDSVGRWEQQWCERCVHGSEAMAVHAGYCPIRWLHFVGGAGPGPPPYVLDLFIPNVDCEPGECRMFVEKPE